MKKYIIMILAAVFIIVLTGCSSTTETTKTKPSQNQESVINDTPSTENNTPSEDSASESVKDSTSADPEDDYVSQEAVKSTVLDHANLKENNIELYNIHLDYDDDYKRYEYEVSFHADNYEYDYEVDALTGEIIDFDKEHIND